MFPAVIDSVDDLSTAQEIFSDVPMPPLRRVLMVSPQHFRVAYAINPYMKDASGSLQRVDVARATRQWEELRHTYEQLGFRVEVLPGHPEYPDLVFAANQSFPFWDSVRQRPAVLLSQMQSEFRRGEVAIFKTWYLQQGWAVHELSLPQLRFEGNGDASIHPGRALIWGGYGARTRPETYDEISRRFGLSVIRLELPRQEYYHLDTCFSILDARTVAIQPMAFTAEGNRLIRSGFERVIEIDPMESARCFAGNCHCPDGKNVILHPGSPKFRRALEEKGYQIREVDTSEFIKSGGSVYCMKMMLFE
jgi:N-dimethylarginine dimethylaminohydrolase